MGKENDDNIDLVDQGLELHIFSFKTNNLFLKKDKYTLNELAGQTMDMLLHEKNDYVCFNA